MLCVLFDTHKEREAEILKPLARVEVVEKEEAKFETEISEDDVPGEWKLKGQVLTRSPVSLVLDIPVSLVGLYICWIFVNYVGVFICFLLRHVTSKQRAPSDSFP